jgi:hypothetical protein
MIEALFTFVHRIPERPSRLFAVAKPCLRALACGISTWEPGSRVRNLFFLQHPCKCVRWFTCAQTLFFCNIPASVFAGSRVRNPVFCNIPESAFTGSRVCNPVFCNIPASAFAGSRVRNPVFCNIPTSAFSGSRVRNCFLQHPCKCVRLHLHQLLHSVCT